MLRASLGRPSTNHRSRVLPLRLPRSAAGAPARAFVISHEREQHLLPDGRVSGPAADTLESLESLAVHGRHVEGVGEEPSLEEALELGAGAASPTPWVGVIAPSSGRCRATRATLQSRM
jgi:hypothetical protein